MNGISGKENVLFFGVGIEHFPKILENVYENNGKTTAFKEIIKETIVEICEYGKTFCANIYIQ